MNDTALQFGARQDTTDAEVISIAQLAEELGYNTFFTGEAWGRDPGSNFPWQGYLGPGHQRPAGHRGLARRSLSPPGGTDAGVHGDYPAGPLRWRREL